MAAQLRPYIKSEDARAQAEFYKNALGGEIKSVMTFGQVPGTLVENKDKVMHLQLEVGGGNELFFTDCAPGSVQQGNDISLSLGYKTEGEVEEAFNKLSEGGEVKIALERQSWGLYYGEIQDKFGIVWMLATDV
jgi:PhnB protein